MEQARPPLQIARGRGCASRRSSRRPAAGGFTAYTVYNHMAMPRWLESPEADHWRLARDVTLWDVAAERQVEITGPDAARFVSALDPAKAIARGAAP